MMGATLPFAAHCAKGHDRIDFTDRDLFTRHMKGEHKAHVTTFAGSSGRLYSRWAPWSVKPAPWKAPKAPTDTAKLTAVLLEAGSHGGKYAARGYTADHLDPDWTTDDHVSPSDLEAGDEFVMPTTPGHRYRVLDTDPEKGWHLQLDGREAWVPVLKLPRETEPVRTVVRVGRAA